MRGGVCLEELISNSCLNGLDVAPLNRSFWPIQLIARSSKHSVIIPWHTISSAMVQERLDLNTFGLNTNNAMLDTFTPRTKPSSSICLSSRRGRGPEEALPLFRSRTWHSSARSGNIRTSNALPRY